MIGVLVLIHEDVTESAAVVLCHVGEELEQGHGRSNEVVEVEGIGAAEPALVLGVGLRQNSILGGLCLPGEGLLVDEFVLQMRHARRQGPGRVTLGIQVEVLDHHRHEALGVGGVVDGEVGGDAEATCFAAQDAHACGVEGHHPHRAGGGSDQRRDALLHLASSLVGEGDGQDLGRTYTLLPDEVRDALRQHPGLAGSRTRDDEQRTAAMSHGLLLRRIEIRHPPIVRRDADRGGSHGGGRPQHSRGDARDQRR